MIWNVKGGDAVACVKREDVMRKNLTAKLARAADFVMRNFVMRNDLTFHVLRITLVANSATTLSPKGLCKRRKVIS